MSKIGHELNEYGTLVTRFKCEYCGNEFTICPAVPPDKENEWRGCLGVDCVSYDPSRDVDLLMSEGATIQQHTIKPLNSK